MTAIAEQLRNTPLARTSRLYLIAAECLRTTFRNAAKAGKLIADTVNRQGLQAALCGDEWRKLNAAQQDEMALLQQEFADKEREIQRNYNQKRKDLVEIEGYKLASQVAADMNRGGDALNGESEAKLPLPGGAESAVLRSSQTIPAGAVQGEAIRDREEVGLPRGANGQSFIAHSPRDTNDDTAGLARRADEASGPLPAASSPELNGGGLCNAASDGHCNLAPSREADAPPLGHNKPPAKVHKPIVDPAKMLEAERALKNHMADTVLSTWKLSDGELVCSLPLHELKRRDEDGEACRFIREAVLSKFAPSTVDERKPATDFLTVAELEFCRELAMEAKKLKREAA